MTIQIDLTSDDYLRIIAIMILEGCEITRGSVIRYAISHITGDGINWILHVTNLVSFTEEYDSALSAAQTLTWALFPEVA